MPFRINHIHIKSPDPRKAAEWCEKAFGFKIVSDETRPFGDRFVRCQADGGMLRDHLQRPHRRDAGAGRRAAPTAASSTSPSRPTTSRPTSRASRSSAPSCRKGRCKAPNGVRFAFLGAPDDVRVELVQLPK